MNTQSLGIIGDGALLRSVHLPALNRISRVRINVYGAAGKVEGESLCEQFQIPYWTSSWQKLIDDPDINGIVVALPPDEALHVVDAAAAAGKHAYWHFPLGLGRDEVRPLLRRSRAGNMVLMTDPWMSLPAVMASRRLIRSDDVGNVTQIHLDSRTLPIDHSQEDRQTVIRRLYGHLPLTEQNRATYIPSIAAAALLGGTPAAVATRGTTIDGTNVELQIQFVNGIEAHLCPERGFRIDTDAGVLMSRNPDHSLNLERRVNAVHDAPPVLTRIALTRFPRVESHQRWINSMQTGVLTPEIELETVLRTMTILKAMRQSEQADGRWVDVEL